MKKQILTLAFALCALSPIVAQTTSVSEKPVINGKSIFYTLPKNEISITITTVQTWELRGPFFRYATRYLAEDNIIAEDKHLWRIESIEMNRRTVADDSQVYQITPSKKSIAHLVSLNNQGIICTLNAPQNTITEATFATTETFTEPNLYFDKSVLGEEALIANSTAKMAELAAKQIYRIRENRLSLITGDLDFPADGESLQTLLQEMNAMEQKLLELFIGKTVEQRHRKEIRFVPTGDTDEVLARFSQTEGLVDKDDLSGTPIYIKVATEKTNLNLNPKKQAKSGIRYRYPAQADITIYDAENLNIKRRYPIAQLGDVLILPESILQENMQIIFDEQSGQLLQIEQTKKD